MKNNYSGFRGWINYIRDYKDNVDNDLISQQLLVDANNEIKKLKKKIEKLEELSKEKDNLIKLRDDRVQTLTNKLSESKRDNTTKQNIINILNEQLDDMTIKYHGKEKARRKNAGAIGGLKAKINELELDLEKANHKITWLSKNQKAPSKEEIQAYDTQMKEVEKRIKNK